MDCDDLVEGIYSGDGFHSEIQSMVSCYGKGKAVAVVWDAGTFSPMPDGGELRRGTVVCQLQYGQTANKFVVTCYADKYVLRLCGHQRTIASDYFLPF